MFSVCSTHFFIIIILNVPFPFKIILIKEKIKSFKHLLLHLMRRWRRSCDCFSCFMLSFFCSSSYKKKKRKIKMKIKRMKKTQHYNIKNQSKMLLKCIDEQNSFFFFSFSLKCLFNFFFVFRSFIITKCAVTQLKQ